jgi:xanthine dehydrogenase YagS FAD-binding subunit
MKPFELYEPTTVPEAVALLRKLGPKAKLLAGGSDLVAGVMKDWVEGSGMPLPDALVDVTTIPQLRGIKADPKGTTIGAITTLTDIVESKELNARLPLLVQAANSVASPLIRNYATLGGNINQRPRCWFLRGRDFDCYKKGGTTCFSVTPRSSRSTRRRRSLAPRASAPCRSTRTSRARARTCSARTC